MSPTRASNVQLSVGILEARLDSGTSTAHVHCVGMAAKTCEEREFEKMKREKHRDQFFF
jgi:hypothetical protein